MTRVPDYLTRALYDAARAHADNISISGPPKHRILRVTSGGVVWRVDVRAWEADEED
jgi:hypothetical protein